MKDIVNLDSANTNTWTRDDFLETLKGMSRSLISEHTLSNGGLEWISLRKIPVENITVGPIITYKTASLLHQLPSLKTIELNGVFKLQDKHILTNHSSPSTSYQITSLHFDQCMNIPNDFFLQMKSNYQILSSLSISSGNINDDTLISIIQSSNKLSHLYLLDCINITDNSLFEISKICPNLQSINITGCYQITDSSLISIIKSSPFLHTLNISKCYQITNKSINAIALLCPQIISIDIENCSQITNTAIISFTHTCPNLQSINISGIPTITNEDILYISQFNLNLQTLKMINCPLLSYSSLLSISYYLSSLISLSFTQYRDFSGTHLLSFILHLPSIKHIQIHENTSKIQNLSTYWAHNQLNSYMVKRTPVLRISKKVLNEICQKCPHLELSVIRY